MKKVITYGTFDLLHVGHVNLLKRAKKLGDYLIVGITSDGFDINRGKINNQESLMQRIEAVKKTGIADEIIVEEYEGQKIDDIQRYSIDIFTVGDDWKGKFDYLSEYCKVIYLPRTKGISSSKLRSNSRKTNIKLIGVNSLMKKYSSEASYVNGLNINSRNYDALFLFCDPSFRYEIIKKELNKGKHILCNSPICLSRSQFIELTNLANKKDLILIDAVKTAYSVAFNRLLLLIKSGKIGDVVSIDATCTSLSDFNDGINMELGSLNIWGPTALLPVFLVLGTNYKDCKITTKLLSENPLVDGFTKIDFTYEHAIASIKVGKSVKSEGNLIISGTKGYIFVPSPWWKTDYFELRSERMEDTKKYFYQLDGEGIRNELVTFLKSIEHKNNMTKIPKNVTLGIIDIIEKFQNKKYLKI